MQDFNNPTRSSLVTARTEPTTPNDCVIELGALDQADQAQGGADDTSFDEHDEVGQGSTQDNEGQWCKVYLDACVRTF